MAAVTLSNIVKHYGKHQDVVAVEDVNLAINDGEFVVLVGPSGCGKSTLLRMVAGLEEITAGEVHVGDRLVNDSPPRDRNMAMVFQSYALYPQMTVFDNMAFSMKLARASKQEIDAKVNEVAGMLKLEELLKRRPRELSGGQRQRVALGRAIVRQPEVFLMDEPLSNLDAKLRVQMRAELIKLHQRLRATTIYVTHDQVEAMTMGQRIVVMRHGRIQQDDRPRLVYGNPVNKFVAGFIGSPSMNFLDGRLALGEDGRLVAEIFGRSLPLPESLAPLKQHAGREVVFGIRPEDVHLSGEWDMRPQDVALPASVSLVESIGSEAYIYLDANGSDLVARSPASDELNPGERLEAVLDTGQIHVFDRTTEESLSFGLRNEILARRSPGGGSRAEGAEGSIPFTAAVGACR